MWERYYYYDPFKYGKPARSALQIEQSAHRETKQERDAAQEKLTLIRCVHDLVQSDVLTDDEGWAAVEKVLG